MARGSKAKGEQRRSSAMQMRRDARSFESTRLRVGFKRQVHGTAGSGNRRSASEPGSAPLPGRRRRSLFMSLHAGSQAERPVEFVALAINSPPSPASLVMWPKSASEGTSAVRLTTRPVRTITSVASPASDSLGSNVRESAREQRTRKPLITAAADLQPDQQQGSPCNRLDTSRCLAP